MEEALQEEQLRVVVFSLVLLIAGGGGGSNYPSPSVRNIQYINGINGGGGTTPTPAANELSPYWQTPYGRGGQNGLVVIGY